MTSVAAENQASHPRATATSEFGEFVLLLVFYGIGATFAICIFYIGYLELPAGRTPCLALAAIVGGLYGLTLCVVRGVVPHLRRRLRLEQDHVILGTGVFAARVSYADIREVWTAPNEILHKYVHNPWPPGVLFRFRTDTRTYEIPLRYEEVDACAVIIWQRSGNAAYWDMHGRVNPPADPQPGILIRSVSPGVVLRNALPHALTVVCLAALALASIVVDAHDATSLPPTPPVWFTLLAIGAFSAAPVWQSLEAIRNRNPDITR